MTRSTLCKRDYVQVNSNWDIIDSKERIESQLEGFKFKGPGVYCTKTDTVVVQRFDVDGKFFRAYIYNCQIEETIINQQLEIVSDSRTKKRAAKKS